MSSSYGSIVDSPFDIVILPSFVLEYNQNQAFLAFCVATPSISSAYTPLSIIVCFTVLYINFAIIEAFCVAAVVKPLVKLPGFLLQCLQILASIFWLIYIWQRNIT